MSLFRRPRPAPAAPPALPLPLTDTDITTITETVRARHEGARVRVLRRTVLVQGMTVRFSVSDLRRSGYIVQRSDDYSFTVTGWNARHSSANGLTVAELDEHIDHLLQLRQRAEAANHLTASIEAE